MSLTKKKIKLHWTGKAIENTECSIPKISTGLSCILTELYSCQEQTTTETQGCWTEKMCRLSQKVKMLCSIFVMWLYELPSNGESRERRDSHRSEMPDPLWPLQNCHMFWCELQVDIFWMSVQSITCGILACSLLDQMSSDPSKNRIHHGQQLGSVINQRTGALRALTATKTFAANKPSLPAGAVKGPELLTGSGSHTSSPGKCHLKFWKCHLRDFLAQRHITHPAPSLELKRQPWHRIAAPEGWDTHVLFAREVRQRCLTTGYNFPSEIKHPTALCTFINHFLFICPCYARSVSVHVCILHNPLCFCYCNPLATQKLLLMMNRNQMCPETGTERACSWLYD